MTNAAITPGTQPQSHSRNTISTDPHPLPITAKGGQIIERRTLQMLILIDFKLIDDAQIRRINLTIVTLKKF